MRLEFMLEYKSIKIDSTIYNLYFSLIIIQTFTSEFIESLFQAIYVKMIIADKNKTLIHVVNY